MRAFVLFLGLLLSGCVSSISKDEATVRVMALPQNQHLHLREVTVELPGGPPLRVRYIREGPRASGAPTLVLIHGTPSSLLTWRDVVFGTPDCAGLSDSFDVIALDLVGHGLSDPAPPYTWDRLVEFVAAFLKSPEIGVEHVCFVGNSSGGEVAWRFAAQHPESVDRLVLIDSSGYARGILERPALDTLLRVPVLGDIAAGFTWRWVLAIGVRSSEGNRTVVSDDLIEENFWLFRAEGNREAVVAINRLETGDAHDHITSVRQRSLLIWGEEDESFTVEGHGKRFERDLPSSRLEVVPHGGHTPQVDHPCEVVTLIRDFVSAKVER